MAGGGSRPGFNIVSFDELYFSAQWVAFAMTVGALLLLASDWRDTGRFPLLVLLGAGLLLFFVATGIPQTLNAREWKSGDVGVVRWVKALKEQGEASEVEARLAGNWKYGLRTYTIEHAALTIAERGKTEVLSESTCGKLILFKFQYATDGIFRSNPAVHPFYGMLEGPPVSALEVGCGGRLHTFLLRADGTLLAFRDLHERNPAVEILTR